MNRITSLFFSLFLIFSLYAQEESFYSQSLQWENSTKTKSWVASGLLGTVKSADLDTVLAGFFISNPAEKKTIALEYLGNLGSPAQSKIYFDRERKSDFLFFKPYEIYYRPSEEVQYFDTKIPYAYINYYSGGPSRRKENRINGVFTVNATPDLNFGIYGDWLNGYGVYESQSTKSYNAGFFGSYMGKHHNLMANIAFNGYENYENGGLMNIEDVTDPNSNGNMDAQNMPVYFQNNVWSKLTNWNSYLNYKYHLGVERDVQVTEDSTANVFIPVTSFIYTFRSETDRKKYYERTLNSNGQIPVDSFYRAHNLDHSLYVNNAFTLDSVRFLQMKHTVGITLNEEFNTFARFGFSGYVTADIKRYSYLDGQNTATPESADSILGFLIHPEYAKETRYKLGLGASVFKHIGEVFTYDFTGEYYLKDEKGESGSFNLGGNVGSKFQLGKQEIRIGGKAGYTQEVPDFFEEYYFSNHIKWDRDFDRKNIFNLQGFLSLPTFNFYPSFGLSFMVGLENYKNYIYWDKQAQPVQHTQNIQVLQLTLKQRIRFLGYIHFDNEVTFQQSSDEQIIPLPTLSTFSNLYFQYKKLFGVLTIQAGVHVRYNTSYYAPRYLPATGAFYMQHDYKVGDYPYMGLYANCHLSQARFFVEYNHLNKGWWGNNYLVLPGYALNPSYLKIGISANLGN
jgi:hypothetical protein